MTTNLPNQSQESDLDLPEVGLEVMRGRELVRNTDHALGLEIDIVLRLNRIAIMTNIVGRLIVVPALSRYTG